MKEDVLKTILPRKRAVSGAGIASTVPKPKRWS